MKIFLAKASNWKLILPAFLVSAYCIYLFQTYQADMGAMIGEETLIIDMRSGYTEPEISEFFTQLKEEGRSLHHYVTGVVDMIFPIGYGLLFILFSAYFLKKITSPESNWMYLSLIPLLLMLVDYKENFNTLEMLSAFPNLTAEMVSSAAKVTSIKAMLVNVSMGLPLFLAIVWTVKWMYNRGKP